MGSKLEMSRTGETWKLRLPDGTSVSFTRDDGHRIAELIRADSVKLPPEMRGKSASGKTLLATLESQLDDVVRMYQAAPVDGRTDLGGAMYGMAWAIGLLRNPYLEDRRASAEDQLARAYERVAAGIVRGDSATP